MRVNNIIVHSGVFTKRFKSTSADIWKKYASLKENNLEGKTN